ncbi:MAG: four helix bundle protein [Candidatus Levybacteria bacterium]|nr:four helix bundle protein [Candidatus Levybacteria bacterium]
MNNTLISTSQNSKLKTQNHITGGKSYNVKARAYEFSLQTITFINSLPSKRSYWIIGDQLLRSATSIGANTVEAQAGSSKRDFIRFYEIALKSANETRYWFSLLRDCSDEQKTLCQKLLDEATEISNMLAASILTLKGKRSTKIY